MDHQGIHSKTDFLDLKSQGPNSNNIGWFDKRIDHSDNIPNLKSRGQNKSPMRVLMSAEELKIRGELEMDVERDLEEEIKDGIYHLALRLHRLYQHRKERNAREIGESTKSKTLSEVNINIRMEGGTKIEIKEIKKEARESGHRPQTSRSQNVQGMVAPINTKRFDWAKSLRSAGTSSTNSMAINKKHNSLYQAKKVLVCDEPNLRPSFKLDYGRRNCSTASGQRKGNVGAEYKLLELGWRT